MIPGGHELMKSVLYHDKKIKNAGRNDKDCTKYL